MSWRRFLLVGCLAFGIASNSPGFPCARWLSWTGWVAPPLPPDVLAVHRLYPWLHFEFGKPGGEDRVVLVEREGWFRTQRRVLFRGTITRVPVSGRRRLPGAIASRVSTYVHVPVEYPEHIWVVGTATGVFVFSMLEPAAGFGQFNYLGHSTDTAFFIPQPRPMKFVAAAWMQSVGDYPEGEGERTLYDAPYVLVALREGEDSGGWDREGLRRELSFFVEGPDGFEREVPGARVETWLVKAEALPDDDFSNARFYDFGGRAVRVGEGDYTAARTRIEDGILYLEVRHPPDAIRLSDPVRRPPVQVDLQQLEGPR